MKLAGLLAGGTMKAAAFDMAQPGVTAYAADFGNGASRVVVINKGETSDLQVRIASPQPAALWRLEAPA